MEQTFNKVIKVETCDVADMHKNWRIVYFPSQKEMIITRNAPKAELEAARAGFENRTAIVLTKRQAPRSFPNVFNDSSAKPVTAEQRTIILKVSKEQYAFLASKGNISSYLRSLIDLEIRNL